MEVSLSRQTQELLESKLKTGKYRTADDAINAGLRALDELSAIPFDDAILDAIDRAEGQIDRAKVHDWKGVREKVRAKFLKK